MAWKGRVTFGFVSELSAPNVQAVGAAAPPTGLQSAILEAFDAVNAFTGLDLRPASDPSRADLRITSANGLNVDGTYLSLSQSAYAFLPAPRSAAAGDMAFGRNLTDFSAGSFGYRAVLHEVGHALGLKQPDEFGPFGILAPHQDGPEFSAMSARSAPSMSLADGLGTEYGGFARTFMPGDIAALQHLYGADFSDKSNTHYVFDPREFVKLQTIWDGGGNDTYDFREYWEDLRISLKPGGFSVTGQEAQLNRSQELYRGDEPIYAQGSIHNAWLYRGDPRSLIENAVGGTGDDRIEGNRADNRMIGGQGADTLDGDAGRDRLLGGADRDWISGGPDNDTLEGNSGVDWLHGGGGRDILHGGEGADQLFGAVGRDRIKGGAGDDTAHGGVGHDRIFGNQGADALWGGHGNDVVGGGPGDDTLHGGSGADILRSGPGRDEMTGGAGADTFRFSAGGTVTDFGNGADVLDLPGNTGLNDAAQVGANVVITLSSGAKVALLDTTLSDLTADMFI